MSLFGLGEAERSPRLGLGGMTGASSCAPDAALFCARVGRGGIEGGALMVQASSVSAGRVWGAMLGRL